MFTYDSKDDTYGSYSVPAGGGKLLEFSENKIHWTVTAKGLEHKLDNSR